MPINIIAAIAENRVIGNNNQLLWHLPADFQHLKRLTMGHPIIMGRKTFEAIGKPLPGRLNVVITANPNFSASGISIVHSLEEALALTENAPEVFIFGGATIYQQALPLVSCMYLTRVKHTFVGDAVFPQWDENEWQLVSCEAHQGDERNPYDYEFVVLTRR